MKNRSLMTRVAVLTGALLGAFALSALADWSAPLHNPPQCNPGEPGCDAPINVGPTAQYKTGSFGIGATSGLPGGTLLDVFGTGVISDLWTNTLHVRGSGQTLHAGSVLTDVHGDGNATWQPVSASTGGVTKIIAGTNITISPASGVGAVTINSSQPSRGTAGGGCYASWNQDHYDWTSWGNASYSYGSGCTCPASYTLQLIARDTTGTSNPSAYLCLHN